MGRGVRGPPAYAAKEDIVIDAQALNAANGRALANVARMALAVMRGEDFATAGGGVVIEARFRNPAMPSVVSQSDAMVKQISAIPWLADSQVALEELGYSEEQIYRVVHYQSHRLRQGGPAAFARQCAAYAADAAKAAANGTVIDSAEYDGMAHSKVRRNGSRGKGAKRSGVLFARIPAGGETCTFCRMLASRGFVYWSKESAGEMGHFHRNCDCRIVASTDADGLEGYDPDKEYEIWQKFKDIEDGEGTQAEKREKMRAVLEEPESGSDGWRDDVERRKVDENLISSKTYRARVARAAGERPPKDLYADAARMLRHRSGTAFEDLYAYDLETGERVGSVVDSAAPKRVEPTEKMMSAIAASIERGHEVAMLHNHPDSSMPSVSDLAALQATGARYGIIVCHDGTVYRYSLADDRYADYNQEELKSCGGL